MYEYQDAAGEFFCPTCFTKRLFLVVEGYQAIDERSPIECCSCGYEYSTIVQELEDDGMTSRPVPLVKPAIPKAERMAARQKLSENYKRTLLNAGYRHQNFTYPSNRKKW